jgi:hypothetical protein
MMVKIHRQERDIGRDVSATEAGRKLETVKELEVSSFHADAAGMEVTVPLPNSAGRDSPLEQV